MRVAEAVVDQVQAVREGDELPQVSVRAHVFECEVRDRAQQEFGGAAAGVEGNVGLDVVHALFSHESRRSGRGAERVVFSSPLPERPTAARRPAGRNRMDRGLAIPYNGGLAREDGPKKG